MPKQSLENWLLNQKIPIEDIVFSYPHMTASPEVNTIGCQMQRDLAILKQCINQIRELCDDQREIIDELASEARQAMDGPSTIYPTIKLSL